MSREFHTLYAVIGRPSIRPERLLRAQLLQILYSIRSERLLMEQLGYNLRFRWFVGMDIDESVWGHDGVHESGSLVEARDCPQLFWAGRGARRRSDVGFF